MKYLFQILFLSALCWMMLAPATSDANPFLRDITSQGNQAYQQEDYARATQEYLKAQDIEPLSAQLRLNVGASYYRQKEYEKASEEFQEATRADNPQTAASAYYNLGNSKYQIAKRDFEAGMVSGASQSASQDAAGKYVKQLEECIIDYQESLKRNSADQDAKFNIEMIRREIKNLLRRQPQQNQQQQQQQEQQQQDQKDQKEDSQKQQDQGQQNKDQEQKQQKEQQQQSGDQQDPNKKQDQAEQEKQDNQGTPTPQPAAAERTQTPSPQENKEDKASEQPTAQPTKMLSISEEMARNILDNLPETRQRIRAKKRTHAEKDW